MEKIDYKKEFKELYLPPTEPVILNIPKITFIAIEGKGDPNDQDGEYSKAVGFLYGLAYTIKMDKTFKVLDSYFDYTIPPLEGLWWYKDGGGYGIERKAEFCWLSLLRQPEFVTKEIFDEAKVILSKKKPGLEASKVTLMDFEEGLCVQCMHIGVYDEEPATVAKMDAYTAEMGYSIDLTDKRRHHEIYISNPSKVEPSKRKTVVRHPIKK